jgi:hypothetical protein
MMVINKAETHDGRLGILVACGAVIVMVVAVGAYLYAAERQLCPGIYIAETVGADEGIDISHQRTVLRCRCSCNAK